MALYFDDDHLNSSDKKKNSDNVKYNGGIDGTAKKWEKTHAIKNKYNGVAGNNMSRNQGTGELGMQQTIPGEVTDTSKMTPDEKFRYLKALGMLPGQEKEVQSQAPVQKPVVKPFRRGR